MQEYATPVAVLLAVVSMLIKELSSRGEKSREQKIHEANNRMLYALCRNHPEQHLHGVAERIE